jgi:hypothetical protein
MSLRNSPKLLPRAKIKVKVKVRARIRLKTKRNKYFKFNLHNKS